MTAINPGILLMLLTAFFQSTMQLVVKSISDHITVSVQLLAYYLIPLLLFVPIILKNGFAKYKSNKTVFHLLRGFITTAAVFCFFYTSQHLSLGVGAVLFNTTPVFLPLLAGFFLKEHTPLKVYLAILISLVGVIIIIQPTPGHFISLTALVGLASGFLMALSQVMLRYLAKSKQSVDSIVFHLYLTCVISTLFFIGTESLFSHNGAGLHLSQTNHVGFTYTMLLALGLLSFFAQRILTKAFTYMPAAKLVPYLYMSIPISSLYGWLFWQQPLDYKVLLGSVFVVLGTCIITFDWKLISAFKLSKAMN